MKNKLEIWVWMRHLNLYPLSEDGKLLFTVSYDY